MKGQQGYINGIEELNKISAIFGHGKGAESATSITADDINAITGCDPKTVGCEKGNFSEYGNEVTYTRGEGDTLSSSATNGNTWSGTQSEFNYYDETTKSFVPLTSGSIKITNNGYWYNPTTLKYGYEKPTQGVDENGTYNDTYQMLFGKWTVKGEEDNYFRDFTGTGAKPRYWVAYDGIDTYQSNVTFALMAVSYGTVGGTTLYYSDEFIQSKWSGNSGVRPVVSLKSDVALEWNNSANEWKIKY